MRGYPHPYLRAAKLRRKERQAVGCAATREKLQTVNMSIQ
jgi:hypothetical protein